MKKYAAEHAAYFSYTLHECAVSISAAHFVFLIKPFRTFRSGARSNISEKIARGADAVSVQRIKYFFAVTSRVNYSGFAQYLHMMRKRRLGNIQLLEQ